MGIQTTEFRIEKGVELPKHNGDATRKYPFPQMEVGDSFAIPDDWVSAVRSACGHHGMAHNKKFSVRKHGNGFRCWRIA